MAEDPEKPKRAPQRAGETRSGENRSGEACDRIVEIVQSLERDYDTVWGSMVKQATRRVFPGFNEEYYGFTNFADLLENVRKRGLIELEFDEERGNYIVRTPRGSEAA